MNEALRILYITHLYPPVHTAGVEVFASMTAGLLAGMGHDVSVISTQKNIARRDLSVHRREHDGVPVAEVTNNLFVDEFEETWSRPEIDALVAAELDRVRPDLVHVHHLLYLSVGVLEACTARGIPVVLTLHDFWLGCARFGQLLHADGTRCEHVDPARCGTCLPSLPWRQSDVARRVARAVSVVARTTRVDVSGPLRGLAARGARGAGSASGWQPPAPGVTEIYARLSRRRRDELVDAVNRHASSVILPAAFMREWFTRLGIEESLLSVETTGVDWAGARLHPRTARRPDEPLRFTFLGTLVPHKGAHLLLEAWEALDPAVSERARLRVFGPDSFHPGYVADLRERGARLGVPVGGRLSRDEVRAELARTDVLVCPSQWLEIRPLVMLEAFAAGARVIATDLGGMREVVHDGLPGRLFPEGDVAALAAAIALEVDGEPGEERGARAPSPLFRGWPDVAASLASRYGALCRGRGNANEPVS